MKTRFERIRIVLLIAVLLLAESCQRSPIPMRTMKRIYYDMFIVDSQMEFAPDKFMEADSMAVYPSIFEKYGYTMDEFLETQAYLISHPDKMLKMAQDMKSVWDEKSAKAERERVVRDSLADIEYEKQQAIQTAIDNFLDSISFACLLDTIDVRYGDTAVARKAVKPATDSAAKSAKAAEPETDTAVKPVIKKDSLKKRVPARKILKTD